MQKYAKFIANAPDNIAKLVADRKMERIIAKMTLLIAGMKSHIALKFHLIVVIA